MDVRRALTLKKILQSDNIDWDILIVDQLLFGCYPKAIAQHWPTLPEIERKVFISITAKLLK